MTRPDYDTDLNGKADVPKEDEAVKTSGSEVAAAGKARTSQDEEN